MHKMFSSLYIFKAVLLEEKPIEVNEIKENNPKEKEERNTDDEGKETEKLMEPWNFLVSLKMA